MVVVLLLFLLTLLSLCRHCALGLDAAELKTNLVLLNCCGVFSDSSDPADLLRCTNATTNELSHIAGRRIEGNRKEGKERGGKDKHIDKHNHRQGDQEVDREGDKEGDRQGDSHIHTLMVPLDFVKTRMQVSIRHI